MKHTLLNIAGAGALLLAVASCGNEELAAVQQESENLNSEVTLTEIFASIGGSNDTRTTVTVDNQGVKFQWAANDQLGLYTSEGKSAAYTYVSTSDAGGKFTNAEGLKGTAPFAAFYPYNAEGTATAMPVKFSGQTFNRESLDHINPCTYLVATGVQPKETTNELNIKLSHLACFIAIDLTLPEAGDLSSITLSTNNNVFITEGTVDLTAETPVITATEKVSSFKLGLEGIYANANNTTTVYMMMAPVNLSTRTVTVTVKYANGTSYKGTLPVGKSLEAGKAYKLSANPTIKGETFLGQWSTSNGYIDFNHISKVTEFEDGSYTIIDWYNKKGYDLNFSINMTDSTFTDTNHYYAYGDYIYMKIGANSSDYVMIFNNTSYNDIYKDDTYTQIGFYLYLPDNTYDYFYFYWPYTPPTVEDLVGTYTEAASGYEGITVSGAQTAFSYSDNEVTITKTGDNTITLANLFNSVVSKTVYKDYPASLTGTVDIEAKTITFDPAQSTMMYYYTFADYSSVETPVVATYDDNCNITIPNWTIWLYYTSNKAWYTYATAYDSSIPGYAGVYSTLTKKAE